MNKPRSLDYARPIETDPPKARLDPTFDPDANKKDLPSAATTRQGGTSTTMQLFGTIVMIVIALIMLVLMMMWAS